jgi:hypothetical protein
MAIVLQDVVDQVASILNATSTHGGAVDDDRHPLAEIQRAIHNADDQIVRAIYETAGHPHRRSHASSPQTVANGGQMPDRVGPVLAVEIQVSGGTWKIGKTAPLSKVRGWIDNVNSLTTQEGYYAISESNVLFFTGTLARVHYCLPTRVTSISAAPACPEEYFPILVDLALSELFGKEGDDVSTASYYLQKGLAGIASIRGQSFAFEPVESVNQNR